ncbi:MAG: efflux transporter outer membrane subunit [Syntrophobacterales bacterium]|jgi:NodT family efflux transporter outer membrane factor (OMF) lipoprotein|nr:efflux transporter outer membrane subunit [Syntrophobacterales bacterium]
MLLRLRKVWGIGRAPGRLVPALAAGALLLFSGCSVGPDYMRPPAETPAAYKENAGWKVAQPQDELPRGAWWGIYHDPRLNALVAQVDINNQNIAQAEANFRQAVALVRVARGAYFPTVTGGPSWSRFRRSENLGSSNRNLAGASGTGVNPGNISTVPGATLSDYLLNFAASWELDIWGKVRRSVESSKASAEATAATLEVARLSAQATVAQNYFLIRSLDSQKKLLDDSVAAYQLILNLTKNRYNRGVASRGDVAQAETQVKSTQAQAIDLGVQRSQLEHAIAVLLGKPPSTFSIPLAPLAVKPPPIPAGVPSELLERRPDIAAAERNMAAANAQIGVAIAAYYPTITLSATGGFEASTAPLWFTWPSRFWSLGAAAAQTIFQGGALVAQTDAARAAYDSTVAAYRQTVLTGFQEVEDNLAALRILGDEQKVQDEAVRAARESARVSTNQYKAGTLDHLALMVVEVVALNNERTAITIQGNQLSASVLLVKALGGGWKASDLPAAFNGPPQPAASPAVPAPPSAPPAAGRAGD